MGWLWTEVAATWAGCGVAAVAAFFAIRSWQASVEAIRSSFRPVLRPIPVEGDNKIAPNVYKLLVKNYGNGPAIGVRLIGERLGNPDSVLAELDVVEPLGPRDGIKEWERVGRRELVSGTQFEDGNTYRLLYQDLDGRWHETTFSLTLGGFEVRYLGVRRSGWFRPQIPERVIYSALVVHGE